MRPITHWRTLAEIRLPAGAGYDQLAAELASVVIRELGLPNRQKQSLLAGIAQAAFNEMESRAGVNPSSLLFVRIQASQSAMDWLATEFEGSVSESAYIPSDEVAQHTGSELPLGWGYFMIVKTVGEEDSLTQPVQHNINLYLYLEHESSRITDQGESS